MDNDGNYMLAQTVRTDLTETSGKTTNSIAAPSNRPDVFKPISIIDQIYGCAFSPENAKQYLQSIKEHFSADGVLLAISKLGDQSLYFHCSVGEVEYLQPLTPGNSKPVLHCDARTQTLAGSLILFAKADFSDIAQQEFELLQPHFARSLDISAYLNFAHKPADKLMELIEAIDVPLGIANKDGQILAINVAGLSLMNLESHLDFQADNFWVAACAQAAAQGKIEYELRSNDRKFAVQLICLSASAIDADDSKIMINFLTDNEAETSVLPRLKLGYGLTAAELEVLELLFQGHSAGQIARIRNSSRDTVRVQLRTLKEKTEAKSQIDLIALVRTFMVANNG